MKIFEADKLNGCPALTLAVEGWLNILRSRNGSDAVALAWDQRVLWIEEDGQPVALITWSIQEWRDEAWINVAYTAPAYRRRGHNAALYQRLRLRARERGLKRIAGGISAGNVAMREAARRGGRMPDYVVYAETLSEEASQQ